MRQSISFVPDRRGFSIAVGSVGRGRPLIYCETGFVSHLELLWSQPTNRRFIETLASDHRVVRFDHRGVGLGDPAGSVATFEERVEILEDLIDGIHADEVDMFGTSQSGPAMAAYAARHPDRVGRLVLFGTFADDRDMVDPAVAQAIGRLCEAHWGLAAGTIADVWFPDGNLEGRQFWARLMRSSISAERAAAMFAEAWTINVLDELPKISAPTLVMHRRRDVTIPFERGRQLAAGIPEAEFLPLEGAEHLWYYGDADSVADATLQFLRCGHAADDGPILTPREREVVEMVTEGLSNADIAARLVISRRTVDAHLEHVREKLGVRSRAQIAAWSAARRVF